MPDSAVQSALNRVTEASKVGALLIGLFYVIGLLIVNIDLGFYGVYSLELNRSEYVLAGTLWAFLMAAPIVLFRFWQSEFQSWRKRHSENVTLQDRVRIALYSFISFLTLLWIFQVLSDLEIEIVNPLTWFPLVVVVLSSLFLWSLYQDRFRHLLAVPLSVSVFTEQPGVAYNLAYGLVLLLTILALYVAYVFPHLPKKFGGGNHQRVMVYLSKKIPMFGDKLPVSKDGMTLGPAQLLLETQGSLIVSKLDEDRETKDSFFSASSFSSLSISKDAVLAIGYFRLPPHYAGALFSPSSATPTGTATTPKALPTASSSSATY